MKGGIEEIQASPAAEKSKEETAKAEKSHKTSPEKAK